MIMCFLLCYPVSFHMLQLLLTLPPISSFKQECTGHEFKPGFYLKYNRNKS